MKPLHAGGPLTASTTTIPASLLNALRVWFPDMLDGAAGGSWTPTSAITIGGSGLTIASTAGLTVSATGMLTLVPGGDITDSNNQTLGPANGMIQRFTNPIGARVHDMVAAGNNGRMVFLVRNATGAFNIDINRSGFGATYIVRLPASTWSAALLFDDGTNWRLLLGAGATAGAHA